MGSTRPGSRWRFLVSPKWLGWHAFVLLAVAGMLAMGDWQFRRAQSGNALSWAYTVEWPVFAVFAVVFWAKTIRDEIHPPAPAQPAATRADLPASAARAAAGQAGPAAPAAAEDEELAAYNAYLARLHDEVRGHGRWHGLR
jgi:hypothetical protein